MNKNPNPRRGGKQISAVGGEKLFVGVDVHKSSYSAAIWSVERQGLVSTWRQPASGAALITRLSPVRDNIVKVFYEAGPTGFGLARQLSAAGFAVEVVSPAHTPRPSVACAKTDRLDCRMLARLGAQGQLHRVRVPAVSEEEHRQVARLREQNLAHVQKLKMEIKSFLLVWGIEEPKGLKYWSLAAVAALRKMALSPVLRRCLDRMLAALDFAQAQLNESTEDLKKLAVSEEFRERQALCRTIPGVGLLTAMIMLTEMADPGRFTSAAAVANYMGLAPGVESSGESSRQLGLMKCGNGRLRRVLIEAAWQWVRYDPWARGIYKRMLARMRARQKVIVAMARRLGVILWRMLTRNEPYRGAAPGAPSGMVVQAIAG